MYRETIFRMRSVSAAIPKGIDLQLHICGTASPDRPYRSERPDSEVCCIQYLESGSEQLSVGEATFAALAGDTCLLPQGLSHTFQCDRRDLCEKHWLHLSGEFPRQLIKLYGLEGVYHFPRLDSSDLFRKLQYYAEHPQGDAAEKCVALLNELFFRMSDSLYAAVPKQLSPVEKMLRYIEQHETEPIRLEQLAEVCEKSPSQAERLFRKEMEMPIYRYILGRKLELACRLLTETGMPIREIAAYLSFEDEFYFSGLFSRKIGMSPSQYRKTGGKKPEEKPSPATRRRRDDDIVLL